MADPLISVAELQTLLGEPQLYVADTRWDIDDPDWGRRRYDEGHLRGAVFIDVKEHLSGIGGPGRHPLPPPSAFAATMSRLGLGDDHLVVVYDDRGGAIAARLWWMLRDIGHDAVRVLDGGIQAWVAAGGELTSEEPQRGPAELSVRPPLTRRIERASLLSRLGSLTLIDARAPERYRGDEEPYDPVAGHVPTAVNRHHEGNLAADGRFLAGSALEERYHTAGDADAGVAVYCGSGITACHNILAMVVAGLPEPMLYPGSWSDWSASGMPVATGPDPGEAPPSPGYEVDAVAHQIVQVAEYELTGDPDAFVAAVTAVADAVEEEGVVTLARYTFYLQREAGRVTSVIVHADADSWVRHHEMLERWADQFAALKSTIRQTRLRLFGPVSPAMRSWLAGHGVTFEEAGELAAGFGRTGR